MFTMSPKFQIQTGAIIKYSARTDSVRALFLHSVDELLQYLVYITDFLFYQGF